MEVLDTPMGKSAIHAVAATCPYSFVPCFLVMPKIAGRQEGGKMQVNLCTAALPQALHWHVCNATSLSVPPVMLKQSGPFKEGGLA